MPPRVTFNAKREIEQENFRVTRRLDWDRVRMDRKAKGPAPIFEPRQQRSKSSVPFPQVYARYANRSRAKGEKPLPPKQWIDSLKNNPKA
jgi:hypothetical protein